MYQIAKEYTFTLSRTFYSNIKDILCDIEFVRKGKKGKISNVASVFDIEATSFFNKNGEKQATMYAWGFGLNGRCVRGRTWQEFFDILNIISKYYKLNVNKRLVVYVHNLAYEFQWFKNYFEWEKIFSLEKRKPLYAITKNGIEFRCSYLLSGYSLKVLGENLTKYKVEKLVGDLDYRLMRHSKTPLTEKEWGYILNDLLVVMAHIQEEIERLGTIKDIPLTKTGYVRELCKYNCLKGDGRFDYPKLMQSLILTPENYMQLKRTYTGGFTHANINYVGDVIYDVHSFDFSSSYPAVMLSEQFPMSKPIKVDIKDSKDFIKHLRLYCCMFDCTFKNIRSKVSYENYISLSRCTEIEHYILNNGRVVEADTLTISLTEQDFFIISKLYEWDYIDISNFYKMYKDYLPKEIITTILDLYKDKTELKGVEEKIVEYLVSKGMINSIYGMCVTDPCRDEILFENGNWFNINANVTELIEKYNTNKQRVLYYAWGVWITAYARANLFSGIIEFKDDYIYSDTDSIKVINIHKHTEYLKKYNTNITEKVYRCLNHYGLDVNLSCPKTIKGESKPIGVWDYEGKYERFKTLGAKRYMYEKNGVIHITIAGVSKKAGVEYLQHTYKTNDNIFNAFDDNLEFPAIYDKDGIECNGSGKLCHTYIDTAIEGELIDYMGNKSNYSEYGCVHMDNTEYTLSLNAQFLNLLMGLKGGHLINEK